MKMKKPSYRLRKVLDFMRNHPEAIDMDRWRGRSGDNDHGFNHVLKSLERKGSPRRETIESECGTPGCIAGWSAFLFPRAFKAAIPEGGLKPWEVAKVAQKILDIPYSAMIPIEWPRHLRDEYQDTQPVNRYSVIVQVLRHYGIDV